MIQNCIIACYDNSVKNYLITDIKLAGGKMKIIVVNNIIELEAQLKSTQDVIVYFDKLFLGFFIKQNIQCLKVLNEKASFVFVETGQCPIYFGMRLHTIKINGFICGIEDYNAVKKHFLMTFNNVEYFPEEVMSALHDIFYVNKKNYFSEVTKREHEIILYKVEGKQIKEISALINNIAYGTISNHITRFFNKTGCKSLKDMIFLAQSTILNEKSI